MASRDLNKQIGSHADKAAAFARDPGLQYLAREFSLQLDLAVEAFQTGNKSFARSALRPAISYCVSCHSQSSLGPRFNLSPIHKSFESLPAVDRLSVFAATRQFDDAIKAYKDVLQASAGDVIQIERATRMALAVTVRVKQSPKETLQVIDQASKLNGISPSLEKNLVAWRSSIVNWMADNKALQSASPLAYAKTLVDAAKQKQEFPSDAKGDIEYLRATMVLHDFLRQKPAAAEAAEADFLIGSAYDALRDIGFWSMHEMYFEDCITKLPHSALANRCYEKLDASIRDGFTGSSGAHVPGLVTKHLKSLRDLAAPK